jgi:hypothetical protein
MEMIAVEGIYEQALSSERFNLLDISLRIILGKFLATIMDLAIHFHKAFKVEL